MCKILIVDDEGEVAGAIQRRLQREGYQIETAVKLDEALAKIQEAGQPYDVIVTDMVMEEAESGMEVLKRAMIRDIFTEVIVLTAYGNVANAVECMKRGAFDYVEKNIPGVDVYDLLALKVEQALERRRGSVETMRRLDTRQQGPGA